MNQDHTLYINPCLTFSNYITRKEQYGSADVLTISGKLGKWQVPYIKDLVESIDKQNKIMVLNAKRFDEVKV